MSKYVQDQEVIHFLFKSYIFLCFLGGDGDLDGDREFVGVDTGDLKSAKVDRLLDGELEVEQFPMSSLPPE